MKFFSEASVAYLSSQRVCVFAVQMPNGVPHAATVHFAYDPDAQVFIFVTYEEYRKMEGLRAFPEVPASLVVGSNEGDMKTLQVDGVASITTEQSYIDVYLKAFPEKAGKYEASKLVFFIMRPTWWRFTDWTTPQGKQIESSE
jgi:uncharacterized protein YhbP (UPF0306 family)